MILSKISLSFLIVTLMAGCYGGGGISSNGNGGTTGHSGSSGTSGGSGVVSSPTITGTNVLQITVNGSLCLNNAYLNEPCVEVKICAPGTLNCQTISGILLDTGSFGLRIFNSVLTLNPSLTPIVSGSASLAECAVFGSATFWGPVAMADVYLGGEPKITVPIQIFEPSFAGMTPTGLCPYTEVSNTPLAPSITGFNGILGVGILVYDEQTYYSCNGSNCTVTTPAVTDQVYNPVVSLPTDSNGLLVQLPVIPAGGATAVNGNLVLGIGTQSNNTVLGIGTQPNNTPSGVVAYPANASTAEFITTVTGTVNQYTSLIDSGSNGLFFNPVTASQASLLPTSCTLEDWFCPSTTQDLSATNTGASGAPPPSGLVSFQIGNIITLTDSGNAAFNDIGGTFGSPNPDFFDWGLPFFYGRNVWIGIEGQTSTLGIGPYWAY